MSQKCFEKGNTIFFVAKKMLEKSGFRYNLQKDFEMKSKNYRGEGGGEVVHIIQRPHHRQKG